MSRVSCVLLLLIYRFLIVGRLINFGLLNYFNTVILRLIIVGSATFGIVFFIHEYLRNDFIGLVYLIMWSTVVIIILFYSIAFTNDERQFCNGKVKLILKRFFN